MFDKQAFRASLTASFLVTLASLSKADILTVDDSGGMDFTDIQSAVIAASDGDTILISSGTYSSFLIENKDLDVFADVGASVQVAGTVQISNLAEQKRVTLSGLNVVGGSTYPTSDVALAMNVNVGSIRLERCTFQGGIGVLQGSCEKDPDACQFGNGGIGADLFFCTDVAFVDCEIRGGHGFGAGFREEGFGFADGSIGGKGVFARISAVALYDCDVIAGNSGECAFNAEDGSPGYHAPTGGFFASGSTFRGGDGGNVWDVLSSAQSDGGHGIEIGSNANIHLLDNTYVGGAHGNGPGTPGQNGAGISGSGKIEQLPGARRKCTAQPIAAPASQLVVTVTGQPGDQVFMPWSNHSGFKYRAGKHGTWLMRLPALMTAQPIGVIPGSGVLQTQIPLAALPAGSEAELTVVQGFLIDAMGNAYLGSAMHVLRK